MADIRPVTDDFAVAPQIDLGDLQALAAQGFRLVINNRPDGEAPGQPTSAEVEQAARAAGLDYRYIPVRGGPGPGEVAAVNEAVARAEGPVLAFCRSGTRSIVTWALAQLMAGTPRDELIELGRGAGYELSGVLP
jgi:uncharacterized protein (TIGR01244 family)